MATASCALLDDDSVKCWGVTFGGPLLIGDALAPLVTREDLFGVP